MSNLGVEVRTRLQPPARGVPTATDAVFVPTLLPTTGPTDVATEVRSISDYTAVYGGRTGAAIPVYDALDTYFREGGRRAIVGQGADLAAALALFTKNHGPGQLVWWDTDDTTNWAQLYGWAHTTSRFFIADVASDADVASMQTSGAAVPSVDADYGMVVGPWCEVPAPSGVTGASDRMVPGSSVVAGLIARADGLGNPNRAAAGRDFPLQYVTDFASYINDTDRVALLDNGVNTFADVYGVLELYGFQTGVDQDQYNPFWQANCSRTRMWLTARAQAIGENYLFQTIDGRGRIQLAMKSDLEAACLELYGMDGLFGNTPQDAFTVEVGASVNTINTIAQGELHAVVEARLSLHAKKVVIDLVSIPVTGNVTPSA